ncbi:MAG: hypothetical protein IT435_16200 [Phycisphaerales bacterium]|nr:hypothetical protein [Phycisphaerales bacterium]
MSDGTQPATWGKNDALGAGAIAGILALVALLGVGPPIVEAMGREQIERAIEQSITETQELENTTQKLGLEQTIIDQRLAASNVKLQPDSYLNQRMLDLVDLAGKCGLGVPQITPGNFRNGKQCQLVTLTMSGAGGYLQISQFLTGIHSQFPDVVVAGFSAEANRRDAAGSNGAAGAFAFELEWYAASKDGAASSPK